MIDAHYHRGGYPAFLSLDGVEYRFLGVHPWQCAEIEIEAVLDRTEAALRADSRAGVGEIGLDRLRTKIVPDSQRAAFLRQLELAAELGRPAVLHGAKCWGEVVKACVPFRGRVPAFLFHGFSRSDGLLPEIYSLNGFVSIGPAILNDHAVNYREMAKRISVECLLVETDADVETPDAPAIDAVIAKLAELRGMESAALISALEGNAARLVEALV